MSELRAANQQGGESDPESQRLRMDNSHRSRNHCGDDHHVDRIDFWIISICGCLYLIGHLIAAKGGMPRVIRNHFFDLLALPTLLAISNSIVLASPFDEPYFDWPLPALALASVAAVWWELVTPKYAASTADPIDAIAYIIGACGYLVLVRVPALSQLRINASRRRHGQTGSERLSMQADTRNRNRVSRDRS